MVNLVIDIGNSFTKTAVFNNRKLTDTAVFKTIDEAAVRRFGNFDHAIVSSVDKDIRPLEEYLRSRSSYLRFHTGMFPPIVNHYKTSETLGLDRFAAVIGASALYPHENNLVIDAGTCITYDFIDENRNYRGGSISPGLAMRFKAMHQFTERLPLIEPDLEFTDSFGLDTASAMRSGVQQGMFNEVLGFINSYRDNYPQLQIILCGGDVKLFDTRLKNSIFAHSVKIEPHLVLIGLNEVIHHHTND